MADALGFPDATDTGVPAGVTLTPYNGNLVINTPGAVIEGLDIHGTVTINADNVTLRNCRITNDGTLDGWVVTIGGTGGLVDHCTIIGNGAKNGVWMGDGTVNACDISKCVCLVYIDGPNSIVQNSYLHDLQSSFAGPHYDGICLHGGTSENNITIRHNTVINQMTQTDAFAIFSDFGDTHGVIVDNNKLIGGGFTVYSDQKPGNPWVITGVQFTNNYLGKGYYGYDSITNNSVVWNGNIDLTTGRTVLQNGTLSQDLPSGAPLIPVIASFATDSGVIGDGITNDSTPTLTGTAVANSTVTVFDGGHQIGTATANGGGAWSYTTAAALANGRHSFTATTTSGGTTSSPSSSLSVTVDTVAPAAPLIANGTINGNNSVTLTGTAEANSTVKAYDGATLLGSATVDASGAWNYTSGQLSNVTHALTATATDAAGNTSKVSQAVDPVISGAVGGGSAPANLVVNGGFEAGDFTGWTIGRYQPEQTIISPNLHSGKFAAALGPAGGDGSLSQDLTTTPGQHYTLDFWLANMSTATDDFTVKWGGTTVMGLVNQSAQGYTEYTFPVVATSTTTRLEFDYRQDPTQWRLDDISVVAAGTSGNSGGGGTPMTSLFSASDTPTWTYNDGQQIEVGAQFQSSAVGQITALKFYRSASDTDSDVLDLWTSNGTNLASATFTNTAASGWETVTLASPVAISANTTYVVSYHTTGYYVATNNFFTTAFTSSDGVLTAPNGVYAYGGTSTTGIFPTNTFGNTNYWADVVFKASAAPAGVAGEAINLGLRNPTDHLGTITVNVSGVPSGWTMSAGADNGDGTWTVQTNDIAAVSVTSPESYTGALVLNVAESWVNADGSSGNAIVADNVEVYTKGAPIFALSGDDNLTGSGGDDLFVFARPIGNDVVYNFNVASDKIDLIDFNNVASFRDIQANLTDDANGNAVIAIGAGETITLHGVDASSLNANDFVFDQQPVTNNTGNMVVSDGATLPLSGIVNNSGTIVLKSTSNETDLELVKRAITLQGGGQVRLSDRGTNAILGTDPSVTLTNVDNTISGAGQLGEGQLTLHNKGTIIASGGNALTIDTGANAVVNSGTLEAIGSGGLVIHSDIANSGLLWANGGNITLDGTVSGTGSALIDGVATFEMGRAFGENITLDAGANATLKIDHAADFSGAVAGFDGNDVLDLADLAFGSNTTLGYAANSNNTGGTLTVSDGTQTANVALLGQYTAASFVPSADGLGGTLIHDPPPATLTQTLTHPQHA